jgi:hypothetical protein
MGIAARAAPEQVVPITAMTFSWATMACEPAWPPSAEQRSSSAVPRATENPVNVPEVRDGQLDAADLVDTEGSRITGLGLERPDLDLLTRFDRPDTQIVLDLVAAAVFTTRGDEEGEDDGQDNQVSRSP